MKGKSIFYCEIAYAVGVITLALGTAFMEKADFGLSMIVAPAYLIHLKVSQFLPFFSFGMSEYVLQAILLGALSLIVGKAKKSYLLSFVTAFIYGVILDIIINALALSPFNGILWQIVFFIAGIIICPIGVALLFHTYFPPGAYDLFVKELAQKFHIPLGKMKTRYDYASCVLSIILSLCFFGTFVGIHWGTIVCTAVNGWLIGRISRFLENNFIFKDAFPLRNTIN